MEVAGIVDEGGKWNLPDIISETQQLVGRIRVGKHREN